MVLNAIEKIKPVFLLSLMCMFPESNEVENEVANEVPQQLGLKKQIKKIGSLVLFSYLLPEL